MKLKTRRIGHATEYYLFAKEGDSILYNDWYQIDRDGVSTGTCLTGLPECTVSGWTLRNRINKPEEYDFTTLWELVKTPALRRPTRGKDYVKKPKSKPKPGPIEIRIDSDYLDTMALFKPGSLAHTVR